MLYYTRFKDCGDGVLETTWTYHNMDGSPYTPNYLNVPWGGFRPSVFKNVLVANVDRASMDEPVIGGWGVNPMYLPDLDSTGGFSIFTQDLPAPSPPPLVLPTGLLLVAGGSATLNSVRGGHQSIRVPLQSTATVGGNELSELRFTNNNPDSPNFGEYFDTNGVWHWAWAGTGMFVLLKDATLADWNSKFSSGDAIGVAFTPSDGIPLAENLAQAFVHGVGASTPPGARKIGRLRYGSTPDAQRDYFVTTVNAFVSISAGNIYQNRQFFITDKYVNLLHSGSNPADDWVDEVDESDTVQDASTGTTVELFSSSGNPDFGVSTGGCGGQQAVCTGTTNPGSGRRAHFTVTCGSDTYVGPDLYHFAPVGDDFGLAAAARPYRCKNIAAVAAPAFELPTAAGGQLQIRPKGSWAFSQSHTDTAGKYVVSVSIQNTATVAAGSTTNFIVSNGVGGTFRLHGIHHWACKPPPPFPNLIRTCCTVC